MHYYGTRLSENLSMREPEGYLLCLNVPVARTGTQEYLPEELCLPPSSAGREGSVIPVWRPEEEVFSPETIASFEGMPVTDGHPPDGVDAGNIRVLQKGHAHNVRRGKGGEKDLLLADLIITDPRLIDAILREGRREISCGYTYELCPEGGRYVQRRIRGNHVAVVDAGRAGPRVSIRDRRPARLNKQTTERRTTPMKKSLSKVLARMAKDGDLDTVAGIIEEMIAPDAPETPAPEPEPEQEPAAEAPEVQNVVIDESALASLLERLDRIVALLEPAAADGAAEEVSEAVEEALEAAAQVPEDPAAGEVAAVMEEILDPVASVVLEAEEDADEEEDLPETLCTGDALRAALAAVRPVLARMPRKEQQQVAGDIAARLRRGSRRTADSDVYAALASARRRTAPASADLGRRIMEKRNIS